MGFKQRFPKRLFDVGIAEEHAVSMAGGFAKQGMRPVVAIYSTFMQRAYDQIMQDVSMLNLPVVLAIDRAGLVGEDGETHHGVFDVGFLRQAPGMTVLCPASCLELQDMLEWALTQNGPVAVRYPRGTDRGYQESAFENGLVHCHRPGTDVTIVTYGTLIENALEAADRLQHLGISAAVVRLLAVNPLPVQELTAAIGNCRQVFVMEETCKGSGILEDICYELGRVLPECKVTGVDLGAKYVTHGSLSQLYAHYGLDGQSVARTIEEVLKVEN
jgi:1-deoxy-D-xylulose-5-phosphate synthase